MSHVLAEHRQILTNMVADATDVALLMDADRHLVWVSPSCQTTLGWAPEELLDTNPAALLHPDDVSDAHERSTRLRAGDTPAGQERDWLVRMKRKDGSFLWMSGAITRIDDDQGNLAGFTTVLHDVDELVRLREAAAHEAARTHAFLDAMLDPFALFEGVRDESGTLIDLLYLDCNDAAWQYNQLTREEMIGHRLLDLFPGQATGGPLSLYFDVIETGEPCVLDDYAYPHEVIGQERRYDIRAVSAGPDLLALTWRDVTDRYRDKQELAASERMYRLATEDVTDAVIQSNSDMVVEWVSPSFEELTGFSAAEVLGQNGLIFADDPDVQAIESALRRIDAGTPVVELRLRVRRKTGGSRWASVRVRRYEDEQGHRDGYVSVLRDIEDEARIRRELEHRTRHDMLTGLPNRGLFAERLEHHSHRAHSWAGLSVLIVGIDRLSRINEAFTYAAGDLVIQATAARIQGCVADNDDVARLGGDGFAVMVTADGGSAEAADLAERILAAGREPISIEGHTVVPTLSIGIAAAEALDSADELLSRAALAMREAKLEGRDRWHLATHGSTESVRESIDAHAELKQALDDAAIQPWFQPIVHLPQGRVAGFEVLARWPDGEGPDHRPDVFVPLAEELGMAPELDRLILTRSLTYLADLDPLHLAVNLSTRTLSDPAEVSWLTSVLLDHQAHLHLLHLEVTETALAHLDRDSVAAMEAIRDLGVQWYVDDFGTGYSSISSLRDLPVDGLKLDRSFTDGVAAGDTRSIQVAQGLAGLAHGLGLETVAEGVGDLTTARLLAAQGWQYAQGYLYSPATPTPQRLYEARQM